MVREGWRALLPETGLDLGRLDRANFWPSLRALYLDMLVAADAEELGPDGMDRLGVTPFEMIERFVEPPDTGARR